jgi:TRAP-type C4-dicarboxylate transport system permease small subunit
MKSSAMFWVGATTLVLILVTVMATLNFSFSWIFYITVLGQLMIVYMVYKVLTDNYKTLKTFEDFYEDYPVAK